jgi:hypothetical protein
MSQLLSLYTQHCSYCMTITAMGGVVPLAPSRRCARGQLKALMVAAIIVAAVVLMHVDEASCAEGA